MEIRKSMANRKLDIDYDNYASLPTIEAVNLEAYWDVVRSLDPELYLIKVALQETGINPMILPRVIRSLANLSYSGGYGKIQIFMERNEVTQIKGEDSDLLNLPTIVE